MIFDNPLQGYKKENITYIMSPFKSMGLQRAVKHWSAIDFLTVGDKYSKVIKSAIVRGV